MQFLPELRFCMDGTNMEWGGMGVGGGAKLPGKIPTYGDMLRVARCVVFNS